MPAGLSRGSLLAGTYNTVKGANARWLVWPALTGVGTPGVKCTAGAGAWGAYADIVAAKAITTDFWIGSVESRTTDAAQVFEVQVRNAVPASLLEFFVDPTAISVNMVPILAPYPIFMNANSQVQARIGGAAAKILWLAILYSILL